MKIEHTPRPWIARAGRIESLSSNDIIDIAYMCPNNETAANTCLFVTAPELLECLHDVLLTGGDSYRHWGNEAQRQGHNEMLKRVRAIVKKATTPQD